MTEQKQQSSFKKKALGAGATIGAVGVLVVWYIISGGQLGAKDFEGQDLRDSGNQFRAQDMTKAVFRDANISGLDMTGIQLHEAEMERVIAEETDLTQAVFRRADLRNANLRGAILVEADLSHADLTGADLLGADLRGANLANTMLDDADLRDARAGPSCVGRRFKVMDHCGEIEQDGGCCEMGWGGTTNIQGVQACTNPFWEIFRHATEAGFGLMGEPVYTEVDRYDNGRAICSE